MLHGRLALAARLLREDSRPVKTVAEEAGFPDPFHFTKMFRHHYGIPPAAYRNELRNQAWGRLKTKTVSPAPGGRGGLNSAGRDQARSDQDFSLFCRPPLLPLP